MSGEATAFEPKRATIERAIASATPAEIVLFAQQHMRNGSIRAAILGCEVANERGLSDPALTLTEAMARFRIGEHERALALVDAVLARAPGNLGALDLKAHMMAALGNGAEARALASRVAETYADYPGALPLLSALVFPGPQYRDVLGRVHQLLAPATYLEIGVDTGASLLLATTASLAVGVDPAADVRGRALPENVRLYALESDAFFEQETTASAFDGRTVDLTFIDGLHWFEYALRDFANAERWSSRSSTIVLHDCVPVSKVAATRERESAFWVGDVWKVLEALLDYRPDLRISLVPTAPSALTVVRGLDPSSTLLFERRDEIVARYRELEYSPLEARWPGRLSIVENSEAGIRAACELG